MQKPLLKKKNRSHHKTRVHMHINKKRNPTKELFFNRLLKLFHIAKHTSAD